MRAVALSVVAAVVALGASERLGGQAQAEQTAAPVAGAQAETPAEEEAPPTPRAEAPYDLTGYWVSIVTEDWRWRMVTPPKGDYASVPLSEAGLTMANTWDPARDEAEGQQCKAYGAPGLMRIPTRLHITWEDDTTLTVDTDAGTQTRTLHFGEWESPDGEPTRQGETKAEWEIQRGRRGQPNPAGGSLKAVTTNVQPGYLRKNGVAYSEKTTLTEHWDRLERRNGDEWIVITTIVEDPEYLSRPWITTLNFKKEPDGSKWDPSPCSVN